MSYNNFKKTVWSKHIQTELPKYTVFKTDCDFEFEGEAKQGERLKILGVQAPTIKTYTPGKDIESPETPKDASVYLDINEYKYFNYAIDDVDKAQTKGILPVLSEETTRALAEVEDSYCAKNIALGAGVKLPEIVITNPAEAKDYIDEMYVKAWDNGLLGKKITLYLSPFIYNLFEKELSEIKTDNTRQITTGTVGMYRNAHVKISNNIYNDGTYDHIILKSSKGYAYANGINELEAYRPEKGFSDAIKGLLTYGGKAVRPKEIICGRVKRG